LTLFLRGVLAATPRPNFASLVVLLAAAPIDRPAFAYVAKISRGSSNLEVGPFFWQNLNCWCDRSLRALAEGENRQHPAMSRVMDILRQQL